MTRRVAAGMLTALLVACGASDDGKFDGGNGAAPQDGAADAADADGDGGGAGDGADAKGAKKPGGKTTGGGTTTGGATTGGDTTGGATTGDGGGGGGGAKMTGEEYFTKNIVPLFTANCQTCHADPRMPATIRGPLTIYSYKSMKPKLAAGGASQNNDLMDKVRNVDAHTGGDRCAGGFTASPCKEIVAWWTYEFGADDGSGGSRGKIAEVTALGKVYGWAFDPASTMTQVKVTFYADGPKGTGSAAGSAMANLTGADGNTPGDHAFAFDLPAALRNGKAHELYAYAEIAGVEQPINDDGFGYTAYSFTQAGRDYYEANVKGAMGTCAGCHTVSYEQQFYTLIAPSPAQGGTATNNQLINKPSQTNGTTHGGGQRCGSANASPCSQLQAWWKIEFGG